MRILRQALRSIGLRLALVALLLAGQQGALTHALTHAGWQAHGHETQLHEQLHDHAREIVVHDDAPPGRLAAAEACAFDLVYSQVLGGVHVGFTPAVAVVEAAVPFAVALQTRSTVAVVPYDSRGPPVLS